MAFVVSSTSAWLAGGTLLGGYLTSKNSKKAANQAADAQVQAAQLGVDESRYQFDQMRDLMNPYVNVGQTAMRDQQNILGLNGAEAQANVIGSLKNSHQYDSMMQAGSEAILGNASATGGLRGGNTQAVLGQFGGQMMNQLIQQQYANLGGLTSMGQNAAAGVGNAGMQTGANISNLYNQQGAAQAGAAITRGQANNQFLNTGMGVLGSFLGGKF